MVGSSVTPLISTKAKNIKTSLIPSKATLKKITILVRIVCCKSINEKHIEARLKKVLMD